MNQQPRTNRKPVFIAIGALAVLLAIAAIVYFTTLAQPQQGAKTLSISIVHGDGSVKPMELKTDAEFQRGALEEQNLISGTESEFGLFITTVDGETADDSQQQWWCITKGGEQLNTGADSTAIADGEAYELTLTTGY